MNGRLISVYQLRRQQLRDNGLNVFEFRQNYFGNVPEMFDIKSEIVWKRIDELLAQVFEPKY